MMLSLERVASKLQTKKEYEDAIAITEVMNHFYNVAQCSQEYLHLDISAIALSDILNQARQRLIQKDLETESIKRYIHKPIEQTQLLICDPQHIINLIVNAIICFQDYGIEENITLFLDVISLNYAIEEPYANKPERALRIIITTAP